MYTMFLTVNEENMCQLLNRVISACDEPRHFKTQFTIFTRDRQ